MPGDDLFKRYLEIGAAMLGMSRERAESIVKDLVASGEVARGQATKAADWLVERGKAGTEELAEMVRKEIRQQVTALGLATKDDVARVEAQLEEVRRSAANAATPTAAAAAAPRTRPATATAPAKKRPAARKATAAGGADPAGVTGSASAGRRPPSSGSTAPDAAPPKD